MDLMRVLEIIFNKSFQYRKDISAENCYEQMKTKFNDNYAKHNPFSSRFSIAHTPFVARNDNKYAFSIGHDSFGYGSAIYGYIEDMGDYCMINVKIHQVLWKELFLIILGFGVFASLLFGHQMWDGLIFLISGLLIICVWHAIFCVCLFNKFEEILGTI